MKKVIRYLVKIDYKMVVGIDENRKFVFHDITVTVPFRSYDDAENYINCWEKVSQANQDYRFSISKVWEEDPC